MDITFDGSELKSKLSESRILGKAKRAITPKIKEQFRNVSFDEIMDDDYFLGEFTKTRTDENGDFQSGLYPKNREILEQIWDTGDRWFDTFIYVAGIGSGKGTLCGINIWMMLFKTINLDNPQLHYGLMKNSTIAFSVMSRTEALAKKVTFMDLSKFFNCPVFNDYYPAQADLQKIIDDPARLPSELRFPGRIVIFPGTGSALSLLGYNLHSSVIDEVNRITERAEMKSDLAIESTPAEETVDSIKKRMESRFMKPGGGAKGLLSIVSSVWTISDYTRKRILEEHLLGEKSRVFWVWHPSWDIKPKELFSGKSFHFDVDRMKIIDEWRKKDDKCQNPECKKLCDSGYILPILDRELRVCSIDCYKSLKEQPSLEVVKW